MEREITGREAAQDRRADRPRPDGQEILRIGGEHERRRCGRQERRRIRVAASRPLERLNAV